MIKVVIEQALAGVNAPNIADIIDSQKDVAQAGHFIGGHGDTPSSRVFECGVVRRDGYRNFALQRTGLDPVHMAGLPSLRPLNIERSRVQIRGVRSKNSIATGFSQRSIGLGIRSQCREYRERQSRLIPRAEMQSRIIEKNIRAREKQVLLAAQLNLPEVLCLFLRQQQNADRFARRRLNGDRLPSAGLEAFKIQNAVFADFGCTISGDLARRFFLERKFRRYAGDREEYVVGGVRRVQFGKQLRSAVDQTRRSERKLEGPDEVRAGRNIRRFARDLNRFL